jgi:hypothetical protein
MGLIIGRNGLGDNEICFLPTVILHECLKSHCVRSIDGGGIDASSGVIFILMQAVATTKFMFPDGVEPGL